MRIQFEVIPSEFQPRYTGDPIVRDWPAVPSGGDHVSLDVGAEREIEGNVRAVFWHDAEEPFVTVRIS